MAFQSFLREYMQMPIVTRVYTTACVLTTVAVVSRGAPWTEYNYLMHFSVLAAHGAGLPIPVVLQPYDCAQELPVVAAGDHVPVLWPD